MVAMQRKVALVGFILVCELCAPQDLTIAAAADLQSTKQDVVGKFQKKTGKTVSVVYGSSGNFFQQVQNRAPFDIFLSANLDYPKKLEAAGFPEAGSYY